MKRRAGAIAGIALAGVLAAAPSPAEIVSFEAGRVSIETASGRHEFAVEIAISEAQRAQGLMYRRSLVADAGMLFLYPDDRVIHMWMKNTLLPLDMLFLSADGRVVNLVEYTVPLSTTVISSEGPARAVLELAAGTAARIGIEPGDRVRHSAFAE